MEARHEIIPFDSDSPIRLFMHKLGDVARHWHESLELLFVLAGQMTVVTGQTQEVLGPDDMLLINSNTVHELHSTDCVLIAVQIKLSKFTLSPDLLQSLHFNCNSKMAPGHPAFHKIKRIITQLLQVNAGSTIEGLFRSRTLSHELLSELVQNFKCPKPSVETNTQKHLARLNNILRYINEHYQDQLTLAQLAEHEHLSVPYLSSFFEKYMGINFSAYYTNLRLEHAVFDLIYTDTPVEQIALDSGFSDPRTFARSFKKRYNCTPSSYRKNNIAPVFRPKEDPLLAINYLDFKPENYFHILSQYLPDSTQTVTEPHQGSMESLHIGTVDSKQEKTTLLHTWRTIIGVGRAKELLYHNVQSMLRQLQEDIGFRYIRFHGIFSDDMLVCRMEKDGSLRFSFAQVDEALDFILSIGLKPVIQFSFMPSAIAQNPEHTIFASPFTISPPRNMNDWNLLVSHFLYHIQSRYGQEEIRTWLYTPWNEPDTSPEMFGFDKAEYFYELYENTYRTVKAFDSQLILGSPSLFPLTPASYEWMEQYLAFTKAHDCPPEFINVHYYSDNFHQIPPEESTFATPSTYNEDPYHFSKFITRLQCFLDTKELGHLPLYISEWNLTVSHRSLINDTCFKGCYLAKNYTENYDRVGAIGYWCLTDFLEEYQAADQLFHGGLGLFTSNGIKKPPYYAMQFLSQLGDTLIDSGEGYFITKKGRQVIALFYNYQHYNPLFVEEGLGLSLTNRNGVFPNPRHLEIDLTLTSLESGHYRVRETILNQNHGSCFDSWTSMGAPELSRTDVDWLRQETHPKLHIEQIFAPRGELPYCAALAPHEVRLVEISPILQGL